MKISKPLIWTDEEYALWIDRLNLVTDEVGIQRGSLQQD